MVTSLTVALFFHILGVLLFAGGIVLAGATFEAARRRDDAAEIAIILGLARTGVVFVGIGMLMLLGFGLWLVDLSGYGFGAGWIQWALGLFALSLVLGAIGGRRPKRARLLAARLAAQRNPVGTELRALLDDPLSRAVNYVSALILIAILALMIFKP
jgi:uncharacterized membrane protein